MPEITVNNIHKSFGTVKVLQGASITVPGLGLTLKTEFLDQFTITE